MSEQNYKKNRIKIFIFLILGGIFLINFVSASICTLDVGLVNQDPYPAIPGEYVNVVFQVTGINSDVCKGAVFDLVLSYPFSTDENNTLKTVEGISYISNYKTGWMIPYKLRVDKDALDGNATLTVKYGEEKNFISEDFDIAIEDSRTTFDAVIQEATNSEVSIALANTGKYVANSVIVRVPEQEKFKATGTDGQMVGNLDSGDYTIVSFGLTPTIQRSQVSDSSEDKPNIQSQKSNLKFDIYYTDTLGERRVVNMELPLQMSSGLNASSVMQGGFQGRVQQKRSGTNWTFWIIFGFVIILSFVLYKKYPEQTKTLYNKSSQKIRELFNKKKQSRNDFNSVPNWIKNSQEKEKKK